VNTFGRDLKACLASGKLSFQALPAAGKLGTLIRESDQDAHANIQFYNQSKKQRTGCQGLSIDSIFEIPD